jgi:hypothetical protein
MEKIVKTFLFFGLALLVCTKSVFAGCDVSVSPSQASVGSTVDFTFSVHNTGSNPIVYVKIPTNLGGYVYVTGAEATGWDMSPEADADVFVNGTIDPGLSSSFIVHGNTAGANANFSWILEASESDAALAFACNTLSLSLTGEVIPTPTPDVTEAPVDVPAPGISSVAVSAGSTTATVSWRLDSTATSVVHYGTSTSYGSTASTTGESVTLSSLSSSTTYHYEIQATGTGGTTTTIDNTFTTAASGSTTTTTVSPSTTTTINTTSTVTKTIVLTDTTSPTVQITTKAVKTTQEAQKIEGKVTDTGIINAGISKIQYSLDSGKSWLPVSEPGGVTKANFSFIPELVEDGNYPITVRAIDRSGNVGVSPPFLVVIDRLPPRIIHSVWHVGPLLINSDILGKSELVKGIPTHLIIQGVGGITEMGLTIGTQQFLLQHNPETGYWETTVLLENGGEWDAVVKAVDGGGSIVEKKIGVIVVHSNNVNLPPKTVSTLWRYNDFTGQFHKWNGEPYGQDNPRERGDSWFLPPGRYYISLSAPNYNPTVSNLFSLTESKAIFINPQMEKWNVWGLLGISTQFEVNVPTPHTVSESSILLGKKITWPEKNGWEGKDIIFSIIPLWDPSSSSMFTSLSNMTRQQSDVPNVIVIPGANTSTVEILKSRGQYTSTFIADPDGSSLVDSYGAHIPLTVRVNRKGIIEEVVILK